MQNIEQHEDLLRVATDFVLPLSPNNSMQIDTGLNGTTRSTQTKRMPLAKEFTSADVFEKLRVTLSMEKYAGLNATFRFYALHKLITLHAQAGGVLCFSDNIKVLQLP